MNYHQQSYKHRKRDLEVSLAPDDIATDIIIYIYYLKLFRQIALTEFYHIE